jgi:hypothetical protein
MTVVSALIGFRRVAEPRAAVVAIRAATPETIVWHASVRYGTQEEAKQAE